MYKIILGVQNTDAENKKIYSKKITLDATYIRVTADKCFFGEKGTITIPAEDFITKRQAFACNYAIITEYDGTEAIFTKRYFVTRPRLASRTAVTYDIEIDNFSTYFNPFRDVDYPFTPKPYIIGNLNQTSYGTPDEAFGSDKNGDITAYETFKNVYDYGEKIAIKFHAVVQFSTPDGFFYLVDEHEYNTPIEAYNRLSGMRTATTATGAINANVTPITGYVLPTPFLSFGTSKITLKKGDTILTAGYQINGGTEYPLFEDGSGTRIEQTLLNNRKTGKRYTIGTRNIYKKLASVTKLPYISFQIVANNITNFLQFIMRVGDEVIDILSDFEFTFAVNTNELQFAQSQAYRNYKLSSHGLFSLLPNAVAGFATGISGGILKDIRYYLDEMHAGEFEKQIGQPYIKSSSNANGDYNLTYLSKWLGIGIFEITPQDDTAYVRLSEKYGGNVYLTPVDDTTDFIARGGRYFYRFNNVQICGNIPNNARAEIENTFRAGVRLIIDNAT